MTQNEFEQAIARITHCLARDETETKKNDTATVKIAISGNISDSEGSRFSVRKNTKSDSIQERQESQSMSTVIFFKNFFLRKKLIFILFFDRKKASGVKKN